MNKFLIALALLSTPLAAQSVSINGVPNQALAGVTGGTSNPATCTVNSTTDICVTLAPYYASPNGGTTTTAASITSSSTSTTVASCSTFSVGNGFRIPGAGASGANFFDAVLSCSGTTLTWTTATSTSVTSVTIKHDESAAFQAAWTALSSTGGNIYVPIGTYRFNGALQDTGGANGIVVAPHLAIANSTVTRFVGFTTPSNASGGQTIFQTDATSGNVISGYCSTCGNQNFTYAGVEFENISFLAPTNPSVAMLNLSWIATARVHHVTFGTVAGTLPSSTTGVGIIFPYQGNDVRLDGSDLYASGFGTCVQVNEHTTITEGGTANCINSLVAESRSGAPYAGNMAHIVHWWDQQSTHVVAAGVAKAAVHIDTLDCEATGSNCIYDPSNLLYGDIGFNVQASAGAVTPTNPAVSGASNLCIHNLQFPNGTTYGGACPAASSTSNPSPISTASIQDNWQSQEASGTTLVNSGAQYTNLATAANVTWASATGFSNKVATYNGSTSYSTATTNNAFDGSSAFSACAWVNPSSIGSGTYSIMGDMGATPAFTGWRVDIAGFASNTIQVYLSNNIGSSNYIQTRGTTTSLTVGSANLACFTYDGSKNVSGVKINVNGVNQTLGTASNTLTGSILSSLPITIGNYGGSGGGQFVTGAIGRVTTFTRVLTTAEMAAMYAYGSNSIGGNSATATSETVTFSATPTFSLAYSVSEITLTANITSFTLAAGFAGQQKTLTLCQNGTGGFTATAPSNVHGFMTIGTTASKCSSQPFHYSTGQTAWIADSAGAINQ